MRAGPEAEFFLFQRGPGGEPTTETHDSGGYFDLTPVDLGEDVRREIVLALEQMGFHVEAAHHEVAPGQHEIDFRHDDALVTADNVSTFRFVVKNVANRNGLHATFMPKPVFGINGSGMHTHQSLFARGANLFHDKARPVAAERHVPALHRRPAAARQELLRDHEPAGELLQAAGARLRSADRHRVVRAQPQPAHPRARRTRREHAHRAAHARPVLQSVSGARRDAARRARRHRAQARPGAAGEQEHLHDEPPRAAPPAHRRAAGQPERGAGRAGEERT